MKYQTTKLQCEKTIRGVCGGCGGKLEPIRTVDNGGNPTYWVGCQHCSSFRSGVDKSIWRIARKLVVKDGEKYYSSMSKGDYKGKGRREYYYDQQTHGMSGLVARIIYLYTHQPTNLRSSK